jgi:hypothetical protein
MRIRSKTGVIAFAVAIILLLAASAITSYSIYLKKTTEKLRDDLARLMTKDSSFEDAQRIASRYRRFRTTPYFFAISADRKFAFKEGDSCSVEKCVMQFEINNTRLVQLHLANPSRFTATVVILRGSVAYAKMGLFGGTTGRSGGEVEYVRCCTEISGFFNLDTWGNYSFPSSIGKPYLRVRLTESATPEQVNRAARLDMHCLAWGRCDWPCEYLPNAWRDSEPRIPTEQMDLFRKAGMKCR